MNNGGNTLFVAILVLNIFVLTALTTAIAAPTIGEITLNPSEPTPQSTIDFSVDINGDDISSVWLIVQECNENICYSGQNVSMSKVSVDGYEAEATLIHADATYIKYYVEVQSEEWTKSTYVELDLSKEPNDHTGNGNNKTPGFELLLLIMSMMFVVFLMRKRKI